MKKIEVDEDGEKENEEYFKCENRITKMLNHSLEI